MLVRVRLVRVGFAVLLDEAVVFVWVASAVESGVRLVLLTLR